MDREHISVLNSTVGASEGDAEVDESTYPRFAMNTTSSSKILLTATNRLPFIIILLLLLLLLPLDIVVEVDKVWYEREMILICADCYIVSFFKEQC